MDEEREISTEGEESNIGVNSGGPSGFADTADGAEEIVDQESLEKLYAESLKNISQGEIVTGKVIEKMKDSILVDIGYKSEGQIPLNEFPDGGKSINTGDEIEVLLERLENDDGMVVLSKEKANKIKIWNEIESAYESGDMIEGKIIGKIKGGLTVDVGLKAFLPGSQVDVRPVRDLEKFIGQKLPLKVIKLNRKRGNIVLSRRALLEAELKDIRKDTLQKLKEGKIIEGIVKNITDYGAFIDLGGIDGLLHITDMSWGRVSHPSELFVVGDKIKVMILKYDKETERVSLGYKQITEDPWNKVGEKYPVGSRVRGKVVSIADYGAFIELEEGVEGLVHISEISWTKRVKHPSKYVAVGDTVETVVLSLDEEKKRISLGMKQIEPNPWTTIDERYPEGSEITGKVRNITDFGAFVTIEEGVDGLVHISDFLWTKRIKHPSEVVKKGQEVTAKVLNIDKENERLSLGIKQLEPDPWDGIEEKYGIGTDVETRVVKITKFGAFVELEDEIDGLIHISEISKDKVKSTEKAVSVGDEVTARVIKLDKVNRKIALSIKAYEDDLESAEIDNYLKECGDMDLTLADAMEDEDKEIMKDLKNSIQEQDEPDSED